MIKALAVSLCLLAAQWAAAATPSDYPNRPVKFVVAWAPGGSADIGMRLVGEQLAVKWKQSVIVENRPGAAGAIGTDQVVRSAPDGYTALLNVSTLLVNEVTKPPASYRLFRDLVPVTTIWTTPVLLVASSSVRGNTLEAVLKEAAEPGARFSYGHHGEGTSTHIIGERLNKLAGSAMVGLPYAGDAPMSQALLGGHITMGFITATTAEKLVEAGKAKVLAQSFGERSKLFPAVPTFRQLGFEDMDKGTWARVFLPAGTPGAIADKLAKDIDEVLKSNEIQAKFKTLGIIVGGGTPADTLRQLQSDLVSWQSLFRQMHKP
ncbi:MAG: tripartite tricarboxylate transporter substrate binding protein [Burkholderiales bacterium]